MGLEEKRGMWGGVAGRSGGSSQDVMYERMNKKKKDTGAHLQVT